MDTEQVARPVQVLGKAGMVCYGLVYVVVAYLAVQVALGARRGAADQTGALAEIAAGPGVVVMWVLAVGLFAFGLWQGLEAAVGFTWITKKRKRVRKRLGAVIRGGTGISLGIAAVRIASGGGAGSGDKKQRELTARLMDLPAGPFIVGVIAAVVIGVGVAGVVSGVRGSFMRDLDPSDLPTGTRTWVERIGRFGYIAKGVAITIIGGLLAAAALTADPGEAGGLDAALRTVAGQPYGLVLMGIMAIGFAAFGVYCFAAARAHRT
ncbi:DUF1206 domain-containing protein [Actinokineospora soli]|uniref:DUF1206 domain-containing protein n=1 Tax=Actinokineospora soli TaxID=1048753 RepID=A0ABW2TWM6_9PSEU